LPPIPTPDTLTRLTGAGAHVEDLAQEVFLRLFRALPHFRGDSLISTYLYRIIYNVAQDEWKRRRRDRTHLAPIPLSDEADPDADTLFLENLPGDALHQHHRTPAQRLTDSELQHSVEQALTALPEIERTVLVLYHQEECSYQAIAAALDLPLNTVRTHLHRGRKRLSAALTAKPAPVAGSDVALKGTAFRPSVKSIAAGQGL
jgi:RNA polymerase sigma-70 factor (ECF subfamily)